MPWPLMLYLSMYTSGICLHDLSVIYRHPLVLTWHVNIPLIFVLLYVDNVVSHSAPTNQLVLCFPVCFMQPDDNSCTN